MRVAAAIAVYFRAKLPRQPADGPKRTRAAIYDQGLQLGCLKPAGLPGPSSNLGLAPANGDVDWHVERDICQPAACRAVRLAGAADNT